MRKPYVVRVFLRHGLAREVRYATQHGAEVGIGQWLASGRASDAYLFYHPAAAENAGRGGKLIGHALPRGLGWQYETATA